MTFPDKHPNFIIKEATPLNGGAPADRLVRRPITPVDYFFVRNHGLVPEVQAAAYRLAVSGLVRKSLSLTLDDLRREFRAVTMEAALECAGNRRKELMAMRSVPGELPWELEAVGNAEWTGIPLADVLGAAGVTPSPGHVAFTGLDEVPKGRDRFGFGGSIPLQKALGPEVILAYAINGQALPPEHGFPLRVVVPGYIGARSVKWLSEIVVQEEPSGNYFQRRAYKLFPSDVRAESVDWDSGRMLGEIPINSVIGDPVDGARLRAGRTRILGYALSGAAPITEVQLSVDAGATWQVAKRHDRASPWAWCLWEAEADLGPGVHELVVRARDAAGNVQPERVADVWNFKGYVNNAWHRIRITAA